LRRKLIDRVGLENSNVEHRKWASMNDEELVGFARKFVEEKKITGRKELQKADKGLYRALRNRGLIGKVIPETAHENRRDWASMNDEELIAFVKSLVEENGITGREELKKEDSGLYEVLRRRKLLEAVFASVEQKKQDELLGQLAEAVDAYTIK
jgi:hypothetical protein